MLALASHLDSKLREGDVGYLFVGAELVAAALRGDDSNHLPLIGSFAELLVCHYFWVVAEPWTSKVHTMSTIKRPIFGSCIPSSLGSYWSIISHGLLKHNERDFDGLGAGASTTQGNAKRFVG